MVRCPFCGYEGEYRLLKTWKYRWWDVYLYQCPKCGRKFRYQVDPTGKRKSFTIKLGVENSSRLNKKKGQ